MHVGLEALVLHQAVHLGADREPVAHRHREGAAPVLGIAERGEPRCRVAGLDFLHVERQLAAAEAENVFRRDAEVGALRIGPGVHERQRVVALELEAAVLGDLRQGDEPLAGGLLQLDPGVGT